MTETMEQRLSGRRIRRALDALKAGKAIAEAAAEADLRWEERLLFLDAAEKWRQNVRAQEAQEKLAEMMGASPEE